MPQYTVIKLGGSIVSPNPELVFDFSYLAKLKATLMPFIERGDKFFLTLGGGAMMRKYRDLAVAAGINDTLQLHWIGTTFNVFHAELVRAYFNEMADDGIYKYEDYFNSDPLTIYKSIKVGGGGHPGTSGDVDAVKVAQKFSSKTIISLKNIDAVYDSDPRINPQAQRLAELNWQDYLNIIGNPEEHLPGANFPVDPIAARLCQDNGISFKIISGWDLEQLSKILNGEEFYGTTIKT